MHRNFLEMSNAFAIFGTRISDEGFNFLNGFKLSQKRIEALESCLIFPGFNVNLGELAVNSRTLGYRQIEINPKFALEFIHRGKIPCFGEKLKEKWYCLDLAGNSREKCFRIASPLEVCYAICLFFVKNNFGYAFHVNCKWNDIDFEVKTETNIITIDTKKDTATKNYALIREF